MLFRTKFLHNKILIFSNFGRVKFLRLFSEMRKIQNGSETKLLGRIGWNFFWWVFGHIRSPKKFFLLVGQLWRKSSHPSEHQLNITRCKLKNTFLDEVHFGSDGSFFDNDIARLKYFVVQLCNDARDKFGLSVSEKRYSRHQRSTVIIYHILKNFKI